MKFDPVSLRNWTGLPPPRYLGGNRVELLQGGDELFPRMVQAMDAAQGMDLSEALDAECTLQRHFGSAHDYQEGVAAFMAKRAPTFTDR